MEQLAVSSASVSSIVGIDESDASDEFRRVIRVRSKKANAFLSRETTLANLVIGGLFIAEIEHILSHVKIHAIDTTHSPRFGQVLQCAVCEV